MSVFSLNFYCIVLYCIISQHNSTTDDLAYVNKNIT